MQCDTLIINGLQKAKTEGKVLKGHTIRSNPGYCDRENRPSSVTRLNKSEFGIRRTLNAESIGKLHGVLTQIQLDVDSYLGENSSQAATLVIPDEIGITYLQKQDTRRYLKRRSLDEAGVANIKAGVVDRNDAVDEDVEVQIIGFGWVGNKNRKIGIIIDTDGVEAIEEDYETIGELSQKFGGVALASSVRKPDHTTIGHYRSPSHESVQTAHQGQIGDIFYQRFSEAEVTKLVLGPLSVSGQEQALIPLAA